MYMSSTWYNTEIKRYPKPVYGFLTFRVNLKCLKIINTGVLNTQIKQMLSCYMYYLLS